MSRVYNFSAGPAVLPEEVLKEVAAEMLDYNGSGMSVMEMSHRSKVFEEILNTAEQDFRDLLKIPDNYKVLFLSGGAHHQFAAVPMNLMKNGVAIILLPDSGQRKHSQRRRNTVLPIKSLPVRIRHFPTFRTAPTCQSARMQIMYIFVKTTPFMEPNSRPSRIPKEKNWWQMYLPVSCLSRWM